MKYLKFIFLIFIFLFSSIPLTTVVAQNDASQRDILVNNYSPQFPNAYNIKDNMKLTPMFTPDNALGIHKSWLDKANKTIQIQNQYITAFDITDSTSSTDFSTDGSPIIKGIIAAAGRGVNIKIQVNKVDNDFSKDLSSAEKTKMRLYTYLNGLTNVEVKFMASSASAASAGFPDFLGDTHNKLVLIDSKVILVSSINFGENAFTNNREAGMVIESAPATLHFEGTFNYDWKIGEVLPGIVNDTDTVKNTSVSYDYSSHTNIGTKTFSGQYNITLFTNPDNADKVVFDYLKSAKSSIHVSMYTISRMDFVNTLIELKKNNPNMDIQVLISKRRVGASENVDTKAAAELLVKNLIPVYNSTTDDDKADGFYHAKYWIIDGKHTFVYSGNWSPHSVSPPESDNIYSSERNRDMGVVVHDNTDIAIFYDNVWQQDVNVGSAWKLPIGVNQLSFEESDILSGDITLSGGTFGLDVSTVAYRWNDGEWTNITLDSTDLFSLQYDSKTLPNGINTLELKAVDKQEFYDEVKINVVNIGKNDNWRVLITEVHPNPDQVDDTEGEFFEITNTFPFAILMSKWSIGDDKNSFNIPDDYEIKAYTSVIAARNADGFEQAFDVTADFEFSFSLANTKDYVYLSNHKGDYVDVVAYGEITPPDGSEVNTIPGEGESLLRSQLHIDTNKASDFKVGTPTPKATVDHISLGASPSSSNTELEPYPFLWVFSSLILLPIKRKRNVKLILRY